MSFKESINSEKKQSKQNKPKEVNHEKCIKCESYHDSCLCASTSKIREATPFDLYCYECLRAYNPSDAKDYCLCKKN